MTENVSVHRLPANNAEIDIDEKTDKLRDDASGGWTIDRFVDRVQTQNKNIEKFRDFRFKPKKRRDLIFTTRP